MSFEEKGYKIDLWLERAKNKLFFWRPQKSIPHGPEFQKIVDATLKANAKQLMENLTTHNAFYRRLINPQEKKV